jgi:hypothetical protein
MPPAQPVSDTETRSRILGNETAVRFGGALPPTSVPPSNRSRARSASGLETASRLSGNETKVRHTVVSATTAAPGSLSWARPVSCAETKSRSSGNETNMRYGGLVTRHHRRSGQRGAIERGLASRDAIPISRQRDDHETRPLGSHDPRAPDSSSGAKVVSNHEIESRRTCNETRVRSDDPASATTVAPDRPAAPAPRQHARRSASVIDLSAIGLQVAMAHLGVTASMARKPSAPVLGRTSERHRSRMSATDHARASLPPVAPVPIRPPALAIQPHET